MEKIRYCFYCSRQLIRKQFQSGPESTSSFNKRKFCDRKCRQLFDIENPKGFSYRSVHKRSAKHRKDDCETCGSKKSLIVHHIDGNCFNNKKSNLKTLCGVCHRITHSPNFENGERKKCLYCSKLASRFGLCEAHYTRQHRYGHPLMGRDRKGQLYFIEPEN